MSKITEIKKAALEAGLPAELASRIESNLRMVPQPSEEIDELLHIAKNKPPSTLVYCFLDWPHTLEGVAFWSRHAHNLVEAEYNSAKTETV